MTWKSFHYTSRSQWWIKKQTQMLQNDSLLLQLTTFNTNVIDTGVYTYTFLQLCHVCRCDRAPRNAQKQCSSQKWQEEITSYLFHLSDIPWGNLAMLWPLVRIWNCASQTTEWYKIHFVPIVHILNAVSGFSR